MRFHRLARCFSLFKRAAAPFAFPTGIARSADISEHGPGLVARGGGRRRRRISGVIRRDPARVDDKRALSLARTRVPLGIEI